MKTDYQTLDARAFGLAAGSIAAALITICATGLALVPRFTTSVAATLIHADLGGTVRTLTWSSFFKGLIGWSIGASLIFGTAAVLYNAFVRRNSMVVIPHTTSSAHTGNNK